MKINMSFPATGCQKLLEITDELKVMIILLCGLYDTILAVEK